MINLRAHFQAVLVKAYFVLLLLFLFWISDGDWQITNQGCLQMKNKIELNYTFILIEKQDEVKYAIIDQDRIKIYFRLIYRH